MSELSVNTELLGIGLHTISDASLLTRVPRSTIRRWLFGYHYHRDGHRRDQAAGDYVVEVKEAMQDTTARGVARLAEQMTDTIDHARAGADAGTR